MVFVCGFAAVLGILFGGSTAQAQTTYYWTTGPATSAPVAGSGTWDVSGAPNWVNSLIGNGALTSWVGGSADTADFYANSSPTSTITVNGNQNVGNITFDGGGYALTGGTLTVAAGAITANQNAEIDSVISGTNLTKLGSGLLTLGGANAISGSFTIGSYGNWAGIGLTSPAGTWSPNPSGGIVIANGAALQNAAVYTYTADPNQTGYSMLFGPGVTSGTFGSLASYGQGPLNLMTTDATPQPVCLTIGSNNANSTFNGTFWSLSGTAQVGSLSQAGTVVKIGGGALTLNDTSPNDSTCWNWQSGLPNNVFAAVYSLNIVSGEVMVNSIRALAGRR